MENREFIPDEHVEPAIRELVASKDVQILEVIRTHKEITHPKNIEISIKYCNKIWD